MKAEELNTYIKSAILEGIKFVALDGGFLIQLPFTNFKGEPVEIGIIQVDEDSFQIDDVGYISGLLFELNEHSQEAAGHLLTKRLIDMYKFNMDYNEGVITQKISVEREIEKLLDFLKVVMSIETVLPFVSQPRKRLEGRKRLRAQLGREIKQLHLPLTVEKFAKVQGKHEVWDVDYRYMRREDQVDILILTADLGLKEPKERVAHIITLASDVLDINLSNKQHRELRVVYSVNGNRSMATKRAVNIIEDYKSRIGYKAFNYANKESKTNFTDLTVQDLSPMQL